MNALYYILEANLYLSVFYGLYLLVFRNETFYQLNRAWLLGSSVLAFLIPLVQLDFLRPVHQVVEAIPLNGKMLQLQPVLTTGTTAAAHHYNWYLIVYLLIAAVMLGSLVIKISGLVRMSKSAVKQTDGNYKIVRTENHNAFSFFNYLFVSPDMAASKTVMQHELIHIRQKHSYDVVYFELLRVVCWFNPLAHLMQNSLKELHEFIADKATADLEYGADRYTDFLIDSAYGLTANNLANTFFNTNQLKKRIMMLHKTPSGRSARLKYLLAVPLCGGLLCVSTFGFTKTYGLINIDRSRSLAPSQHVTKVDQKVANWENEYTNGKGNHIHETINTTNGVETKTVVITEKGGSKHTYIEGNLSAGDKKMLLDKYGYTFPKGPIQTVKLSPPPPPAKVDFARPNPLPKTSKGYKYVETGYRIAGKSDYRAIIVEQNGEEKEFWRSKASAADIKLLNDKYGYVFPSGPVHVKTPPPPPAPPVAPKAKIHDQVKLPPAAPGAPKAKIRDQVKLPPPPPPVPAKSPDVADHKAPPPPPVPPAKPADKTDGQVPPPPPPPTPQPDAKLTRLFRPPTPYLSDYKPLMDFLWSHIPYSQTAKDKMLTGNVVAEFTVTADHHITDIKIISGLGYGLDNDFVQALKAFQGTLPDVKPGISRINANFNLVKNGKAYPAPDPKNRYLENPGYAGSVSVYASAD